MATSKKPGSKKPAGKKPVPKPRKGKGVDYGGIEERNERLAAQFAQQTRKQRAK
jgi:hypothetical protein